MNRHAFISISPEFRPQTLPAGVGARVSAGALQLRTSTVYRQYLENI